MFKRNSEQAIGWISMTDMCIVTVILLTLAVVALKKEKSLNEDIIDKYGQACCINDECQNYIKEQCLLMGGEPFSGKCVSDDCAELTYQNEIQSACCINGKCELMVRAKCENIMGVFYDSISCDKVLELCDTPESSYACCINGKCELMVRAKCENIMGVFYDSISCDKVLELCDTPESSYACCIDGECALVTMQVCDIYNGIFSDGENCQEVDCLKSKGENELPLELFNLVPPFDNVVFLVDKSEGMGDSYFGFTDGGTKWQFVKDKVSLWLEYLPIREIALVKFNNKVEIYPKYNSGGYHLLPMKGGLSSARRKQQIDEVVTILGDNTGNTTNIANGFISALKYNTSAGKPIDAIIFFSDGVPTTHSVGETIDILKKRGAAKIPIHIIAVGNFFTKKSKEFYNEILKLNVKNSWRGSDGELKSP